MDASRMPGLDLTDVIRRGLAAGRRAPDGMLHPSSALVGSLRHAQLAVAGAPENPRPLVQDIRMQTGTMWHEWIERELRGLPVMSEVNLTPWMPPGWSGTADILVWNSEYGAFELHDVKTAKGESIPFVARDGAKKEHVWQVSAYWHAARRMLGKVGMRERAFVYYMPMNDTRRGSATPEPIIADFEPLPQAELTKVMVERAERTEAYLDSLPADYMGVVMHRDARLSEIFLTPELAPEIEMELRLERESGPLVIGDYQYRVVGNPHWSTMFCPYPVEICACSTQQKNTTIGVWARAQSDGRWYYMPREGMEHIEPPAPEEKEDGE